MTQPVAAAVPDQGTVHDLDARRAAKETTAPKVSLVKTVPAPDTVARPGVWRRGARAGIAALRHERTRTAGRLVVRHGAYVAGGARIAGKRAWDGRTTARYERMMRSAEAGGNTEEAREWEERARQFRAARHQRRMDLLKAPQQVAKAAGFGIGVGAGGLLVLGGALAIANEDITQVIAPTMFVIELVRWLVVIAAVVWGAVKLVGIWLLVLALWGLGRRGQAAPNWALPAGQAQGREAVPDESAIVAALRNMSIPALNKAFKDGWQPRWVQPTTRLGNGWHTQLQLPLGVTVEMLNAKKTILAHNLLRLPVEVWPTEPRDQPGVLDLWVADQGSLSGKVPPWPLLEEGGADYFTGVPVGVSQRGDQVNGKLMASNYMVGGIMGTGKSSMVIALLLGAMLDPLVDIDVYVMAFNVDYDPMQPRLRTLVKGDDDEQVEAALEALRDLRDEVTRRGKLLDELGGKEVRLTREIAQRDARMRPRVVVFDECHELFEHKTFGPEAAELAVKVLKKARKVGITLIFTTVSPTATSIPKDVTRNTSHRAAFAVGDHVANDGLLGTGKHRAGITATTLNPAEDIGTTLTVGFTKNTFELVRTHHIRKDAEVDQVTPVVERAMALYEGQPAPPPPSGDEDGEDGPDPLADIARVIGDNPRMRTDEVRQQLAALNPAAYRAWTASDLTRVLETAGAAPYKSQGVKVVGRDRVREALDERDHTPTESDAA